MNKLTVFPQMSKIDCMIAFRSDRMEQKRKFFSWGGSYKQAKRVNDSSIFFLSRQENDPCRPSCLTKKKAVVIALSIDSTRRGVRSWCVSLFFLLCFMSHVVSHNQKETESRPHLHFYSYFYLIFFTFLLSFYFSLTFT